jgi:hypothetical protein
MIACVRKEQDLLDGPSDPARRRCSTFFSCRTFAAFVSARTHPGHPSTAQRHARHAETQMALSASKNLPPSRSVNAGPLANPADCGPVMTLWGLHLGGDFRHGPPSRADYVYVMRQIPAPICISPLSAQRQLATSILA